MTTDIDEFEAFFEKHDLIVTRETIDSAYSDDGIPFQRIMLWENKAEIRKYDSPYTYYTFDMDGRKHWGKKKR